jgi:hypothetical protein
MQPPTLSRSTVQFASRLFLHDHAQGYFTKPWEKLIKPIVDSRILFLLGDIGFRQALHTHDFIQYCAANWEQIYWIEGRLEKEKNPDGNPARTLPANVKYISKPTLFQLDDKFQGKIGPIYMKSSPKPLLLYITPFNSYSDMKYLRNEAKKEFYHNYLVIAAYNSRPWSLDYYPTNCVGWFSGISFDKSSPTVNMYKNRDNILETGYSPTKHFSI